MIEREVERAERRRRRNEIAAREHENLFPVYRGQVEHGDYDLQRALLSDHIVDAIFFLSFDGFMLGWAMFYQPRIPSRPLFFAEKIWFMTWIMS